MIRSSVFLVVWSIALGVGATEYFVDSKGGDDAAAGTSPASAWQSVGKVNRTSLQPGDVVRFKCGGLWRGSLAAKSGQPGRPVTYTSYGQGRKPIIQNTIDCSRPEDWAEKSAGFWQTRPLVRADGSACAKDFGVMIIDGERRGSKKFRHPEWIPGKSERFQRLSKMCDDLDFEYDADTKRVTVKHEGNPGESFKSIELAATAHVVSENACRYVTYDGLWIRYTGSHGFGGGGTMGIVIRNCDISTIGGGLQFWRRDEKTKKIRYPVRYGNGIEFWGACCSNLVERCRIWDVYDAALTNQSNHDPRPERDVVWRDNVIWNAEYSYEYWNHDPNSSTSNILFEHNTCIDAGYCQTHNDRHNPNGAHLMFYANPAPTTNFVVRYNVFVRASDYSFFQSDDWKPDVHDNLVWIPENRVYVRSRDPRSYRAGAKEFARYQQETGLDRDSIFREPKFYDEAKRDYRLVDAPKCPDGTVYGARIEH